MCKTRSGLQSYQQASFSAPLSDGLCSRPDIDDTLCRSAGPDRGSTPGERSRLNSDASCDPSSETVPEPPKGTYIKIRNKSKFIVDVEIKWRDKLKKVGGTCRRGWLARLGITSMGAGVGFGGGSHNQEHFNYENSAELKQRLEPERDGEIGDPILFEKPKGCYELYIILKACIEPKETPIPFKIKAYDTTNASYELRTTDAEIMTHFDAQDLRRLKRVAEECQQAIQDIFR